MPFLTLTDETEPQAELRQTGPNTFELVNGFRYREKPGAPEYTVPPHEAGVGATTDIASVPWFLWALIASHGRQTLPALLHDHLCEEALRIAKTQGRRAAREKRREADRLFRVTLGEQGVAAIKQLLFWTAVSFNRYLTFAKPLGALLGLQMVASGVFLLAATARYDRPGLWLALAAPAVASVVWWRDAKVALIGSYAAALVLPVAVVNLAAALVLYILAFPVGGLAWAAGTPWRTPGITPFRSALRRLTR